MSYPDNVAFQHAPHTFSILMNQLDKIRSVDLEEDVTKIVEQIKILENFSYNKNRYYLLFSFVDFSPVYVSANIIQHGYTQEEFINLTAYDLYKALYWKQLSIGVKVIQWFQKFRKIIPDYGRNRDELIFFGVKLKGKQKKLKTFLLKCRWISNSNPSKCGYAFFEVEDVENLYKTDSWWGKYKATRNKVNIARYYFPNGYKQESSNLFSQREWEILQLIIKHKDSTEISQLLDISVETVKKHRKNMIARTGVKDTTALVQLLKLGGIIN